MVSNQRSRLQERTHIDEKERQQTGTFYAKDIEIHQRQVQKTKPQKSSDYIFGKTFTDHMLTIDWSREAGW